MEPVTWKDSSMKDLSQRRSYSEVSRNVEDAHIACTSAVDKEGSDRGSPHRLTSLEEARYSCISRNKAQGVCKVDLEFTLQADSRGPLTVFL